MRKSKMVVTSMDKSIAELVSKSDHNTVAMWAADCAERILPYFEDHYPEDKRPRQAIEALRAWIQTGVFKMADVRKVALASHAAAREVQADDAARSAARAAGQALATAHVAGHAAAAAIYAATAIRDATDSIDAAREERDWQYQHLLRLGENDEESLRLSPTRTA